MPSDLPRIHPTYSKRVPNQQTRAVCPPLAGQTFTGEILWVRTWARPPQFIEQPPNHEHQLGVRTRGTGTEPGHVSDLVPTSSNPTYSRIKGRTRTLAKVKTKGITTPPVTFPIWRPAYEKPSSCDPMPRRFLISNLSSNSTNYRGVTAFLRAMSRSACPT